MTTANRATRPVVLVTGAATGIGRGIAEVLASRGWTVVVNDVDPAGAAAAANALQTTEGVTASALPGDVTGDPETLVAAAVALHGRLDGLVNNAGIIRRSHLAETPADDLDAVYAVNLKAVIRLSQAALPHLAATGGSIVNVSSIAAQTPQPGAGVYSAVKAGVSSFTRHAALEWGRQGVRVNAVAPGMVRTAMAEVVYAVPELHERRRAMVPLGRIGVPADIGRVVAFLLSDDAAYVTGQIITVDGGFTQTLIGLLPHPSAD